ncbi:MAG: PHP domain-containing protein [Clostridia bacterium]|nr:PHP domain-containing protein [Clostridia bacterium]
MELCDLHTHSIYSDGADTPTELVGKASKSGLKAVALTDHNTIAGLLEFSSAGQEIGLETINGVEFSTDYNGKEVHVVSLFIKEKYFSELTSILAKHDEYKEKSNIVLVDGLSKLGYDIDYEKIKKSTPRNNVNRVQIANALMEKGYVKSIKQAFDGVLSKEYGLYVEPQRLEAKEIISYIRDIGAVSVLAHPFLNLEGQMLLDFIEEMKKQGLNALETNYSTFSIGETLKAKELADKYFLLYSGGSDYHGKNKPDIKLGVGKGDLVVPYEYLEKLKGKIR